MVNLVQRQKAERDALMSRDYAPRMYEGQMEEYLDTSPIKLITGPRRAGKSVFVFRMLKGRNFAYLNFDDKKLTDGFDENKIEEAIKTVYPEFKYLVLDEVQNLPDWNDWVGKLYRKNYNLIITGSNANLLSKEMESKLTGRFLSKEVLTFSLKEYCSLRDKDSGVLEKSQDYLLYGGYPEVINNQAIAPNYLSSLFDSILSKDIIRRYKVRNSEDLYSLAELLLSNYASDVTYMGLTEIVGMRSENTVKKYVSYLQTAYLFYMLPRFDHKLKVMQKAPHKVYAVDNGLITAKGYENSPNNGRRLENQVFLELVRRGHIPGKSLFYYHTRNEDKEIDFVCRKGMHVEELIQVCWQISTLSTLERETASLEKASKELNCSKMTIIVWTMPEMKVPEKFRILTFDEWALAD